MASMTNDLPDFDALWNYDEPAQTEAAFRAILPQAEAAGQPDYHAQLLTQIARTQGLQRRFDEAHATLDGVESMLPQAGDRTRVRYLLERGRAFNSAKQVDQARPLFVECFEFATVHGLEYEAIDAAHMLGIIEPPEESMAWNLRAMELAGQARDPRARKWRGSLCNNLGWTYHDQGDYDQAMEMFQAGLAARREQGDPKLIRVAQWTIARTLRSQGHHDEALAMQRALAAELRQLGEAEDGYTSEEIGECLLALGQAAEARPHFAQAHALLSADPWLAENEPERLARLKALGQGERTL